MIRTSSALFWFGLAIIASIALYRTSDRVSQLNHQLTATNAAIEAEQQSIHVLKAEWVYLANPSRIETLAKKHLALQLTSPKQIGTIDNLAAMFPTHHEAMASVTVTTAPTANLRTALAAPAPQALPAHNKVMDLKVASADFGHITDHMMIQRTAIAQASPDSIGTLISQLDSQR